MLHILFDQVSHLHNNTSRGLRPCGSVKKRPNKRASLSIMRIKTTNGARGYELRRNIPGGYARRNSVEPYRQKKCRPVQNLVENCSLECR